MVNTVIFKWNPAISSVSMLDFLNWIYYKDIEGDWSVRDYDRVRAKDVFYMLKVGKGQTGIVMNGLITAAPERGEDWSGQGRVTYYGNYKAQIMINPDTFPLLTSEELYESVPDFDWFGGHSGVVLNKKQTEELKALWEKYLQNSRDEFKARLELMEQRNMTNDQLYLAPRLKTRLFGDNK